MQITCPSCGCKGSLELFIADREFREAILDAARLPSNCGALTMRYIGLFRAQKRQLTPARATKLIHETLGLLTTKPTRFNRQEVEIPTYIWQRALQAVLDKPNLQRPLKNHNLLISIAMHLATSPDQTVYTEDKPEVATRCASTGASMKAVGNIVDGSAQEEIEAEKKLGRMNASEKALLHKKAREELIRSGIPENLIIKPMVDGMMLSIIRGKV